MQEAELRHALAHRLGVDPHLELGRSRSHPVQASWPGGNLRLRLHRMFLDAPPDILDALCSWLQVGRRARRACRELDAWVQAGVEALPPRRPGPLRPQGSHHDLRVLQADEMRRHVAQLCPHCWPAITWGRRGRSSARHSLQLGVYDQERRLIRIHPCLDHPSVPAWFLRFVIYHETLHAVLGQDRLPGGRRSAHGPRFREQERRHPDFEAARTFEKNRLESLLRRARSGT